MPLRTNSVPRYCKHKASGRAYVKINGVVIYLGFHGTQQSKNEYDRVISEWLLNGRRLPKATETTITVVEMLVPFWEHVKAYYVKNGEPTKEVDEFKYSLQLLRDLYGNTPVTDFTPVQLKVIRQKMLENAWCRSVVNKRVARIKRAFKWAVSESLIPPAVFQALETVEGLRRGRSKARETEPITPIDQATVDLTIPECSQIIGDMIRVQLLTGMRPGEVCIMRLRDINQNGKIWIYEPESHKTEHHNRRRLVTIGPRCQLILAPYLADKTPDAFVFSPKQAEVELSERRRQNRKSPVQPSQLYDTRRKKNRKTKPGVKYRIDSYRRAIHRACDRAEVERWSPNRLRHTRGTEIRERYGLDAAQCVLGHASADITQVYAEIDLQKAIKVAEEMG